MTSIVLKETDTHMKWSFRGPTDCFGPSRKLLK